MRNLQNAIKRIRDALKNCGTNYPVSHYRAKDKSAPGYIVWAEDTSGDLVSANNRHVAAVIQATVDLYTAKEYDDTANLIEEALGAEGLAYYLNSVQYEDETGLIHIEWVVETT